MRTDPSKWEMVDDATVAVLRQMTLGERLSIANDLFQMARRSLRAQVEDAHSEWEVEQVSREVARQIAQGVEPPGCDLASWFRLHADQFGEGPWAADEAIYLAAEAGTTSG
jgi:hypothetical protein